MSKAQRIMLFGLWKRAKAKLMPGRETWTKAEEDARRRAVTVDALGAERSWSNLNNDEVDKIKAALLAIVEPGNLAAQLHQAAQEANRLIYGIRRIQRAQGLSDDYVQAIIDRMDARRGDCSDEDADEWQRELERDEHPQRKLADLAPADLLKLRIALEQRERRGVVHEPAEMPF
jgi:hypothetical protein